MHQKAFRFAAWRRTAMLLVAGSFLAGCVARPEMTGVPPSPNSRLYAYLIAHGMARGAVMTGQIGRDGLLQLVTLDRSAQLAVFNAMRLQNASANRRADAALANLLADLPQKAPPLPPAPAEQTQKNRLP